AQALGAGKRHRVNEALKWAVAISLGFSALFFTAVNLFAPHIASIFTKSAEVTAGTVSYFRIVTFTYFFFSLLFVFQGVIRGAGDTVPSTAIAFISLLLIRGSLAHFLPSVNGLNECGIWIALVISAATASLLNGIYFSTGRWARVYDRTAAKKAAMVEDKVQSA
ncbi:MAG TPA: MATE family efflux transporter, partial [Candidatus Goldiibacteriota bacterium]|nr:MATE family efflux transporter [Candidatus Goldiibacteriota bacterium]